MAAGILLKRRAARIGNYDFDNPPHKLGFHSIIDLLTDGIGREDASDMRAELAAATKAGKIAVTKSGVFQWLHTNSAGKVEIESRPMTDSDMEHLENGGTWHGDKAIYDDRETQHEAITFFSLGEPNKNLSRFKGQTGPFIHWHYDCVEISTWLETLGIDAQTLRAWLETGANTGKAQGEGQPDQDKPETCQESDLALGRQTRANLKALASRPRETSEARREVWKRWQIEAERIQEGRKRKASKRELSKLVKESLNLPDSIEAIRKHLEN